MAELKLMEDAQGFGSAFVSMAGPAFEPESALSEDASDRAGTQAVINELRQIVERWEGRAVIARHDRSTGAWILIALHDATLGTPVGGCRMSTYPAVADALRDAMRLAEAMTRKMAVIDAGLGGGKAVIAVPRPLEGAERAGLIERFGHLLESLCGIFSTGEDLGTTPADIARMAAVTSHVHGFDKATGRLIDSGIYTAAGILAGMKTALVHACGDACLSGRTVLIQGVGHVGEPLARMLSHEGAILVLSDIREERVGELAAELDCETIKQNQVYSTGCDIYAPCARGGTLNRQSITELKCRIVAGAANNQLEDESDADLLHKRGILYAPDYVINAGGAIALPMLHRGASEALVQARVAAIADTLDQIFAEAASLDESPLRAAERRVERVLAAARAKAQADSVTDAPKSPASGARR